MSCVYVVEGDDGNASRAGFPPRAPLRCAAAAAAARRRYTRVGLPAGVVAPSCCCLLPGDRYLINHHLCTS